MDYFCGFKEKLHILVTFVDSFHKDMIMITEIVTVIQCCFLADFS